MLPRKLLTKALVASVTAMSKKKSPGSKTIITYTLAKEQLRENHRLVIDPNKPKAVVHELQKEASLGEVSWVEAEMVAVHLALVIERLFDSKTTDTEKGRLCELGEISVD